MITYSGSLDWYAPRQRELVHRQPCPLELELGWEEQTMHLWLSMGSREKVYPPFLWVFRLLGQFFIPSAEFTSLFFSAMPFHLSSQQLLIFSISSLIKGGFPNGSAWKESTYNAADTGDMGSIYGSGRSPGEGIGYPLQYSGLESSMDCSPWGHKELDTTEWLSLFHLRLIHLNVYYKVIISITKNDLTC